METVETTNPADTVQTPVNPTLRWYVVQSRSNMEKSAAQAIRDRIARFELQPEFGAVLVPTEDVVEMKNGQKRKSERKFFPGYILVQIGGVNEEGGPQISSEAWHLIKETTNITGFIGGKADRPLPITEAEAGKILSRVAVAAEKPVSKFQFDKGQMVRVTEGPFADFNGVVASFDPGKGTVRVDVLVFGRATPVEFSISQVEAA